MRFDPTGADVLSFALDAMERGSQVSFATLVNIDGSSPRAIGAQMAICEDGSYAGSISSGCLERAIIEEAQLAMQRGDGGAVRYGKGSRFVDVVLPCGSGVDILFTIAPDQAALAEAKAALQKRNSVTLCFSAGGAASEPSRNSFLQRYHPSIRVVAAGFGPELSLLATLAHSSGFDFCAMSPDENTLNDCPYAERIRPTSVSQIPDPAIDKYSACVLLFHDREWERALAPLFLRSPAFYVGAVGGQKTAAARRDILFADGLSAADMSRLSAPIGLIPMTRDPAALAISILAEIIVHAGDAW